MNSRIDAWQLHGHTALVTGASRGIGYAAARELASLGANLLLVARDADRLEQVRVELADDYSPGQVLAFGADLTDAEERLATFDWINDLGTPLSLLVNNVGGNQPAATLDYTEDDVRGIFEKNLLSAFEMCRLAHPQLVQHAHAAIVNVGSVAGITHVRTGSAYGMSKAALHQLTRNLAAEWAVDGIRVNAIHPGGLSWNHAPDFVKNYSANTMLGRLANATDLKGVIVFLASDASAYLTATNIPVDGGYTAK